MVSSLASARDIDQTSTVLDAGGFIGGTDYEKIENARLLSSSEYSVNSALGYVSPEYRNKYRSGSGCGI